MQVCASTPTSRRYCRGVTLPELLLVASILVLLGSTVMPQLESSRAGRIDLAASAVANALRFARDESVRTGLRHMVTFDLTSHRIQVAQLTSSGPAPLPLPLARHPLSRQPYLIDLDDDPSLGASVIAALDLDYESVGSQSVVDFGPAGVPHYQSLSDSRRLLTGRVRVALDGLSREILIQPQTGSVAITGGP